MTRKKNSLEILLKFPFVSCNTTKFLFSNIKNGWSPTVNQHAAQKEIFLSNLRSGVQYRGSSDAPGHKFLARYTVQR